jgi:hypothetical protein
MLFHGHNSRALQFPNKSFNRFSNWQMHSFSRQWSFTPMTHSSQGRWVQKQEISFVQKALPLLWSYPWLIFLKLSLWCTLVWILTVITLSEGWLRPSVCISVMDLPPVFRYYSTTLQTGHNKVTISITFREI